MDLNKMMSANRFTPLLFAVQNGYLDIVKYLISVGCDREAEQKTGLTPLSVAAFNGHLDIVQYLFTVGCVRETKSKDGRTALHVASQYGHFHVTKWLIEEGGISPVVLTYKGKTPFQLAAERDEQDSSEKRKEKNEIMDFLKTVMSTEKQKVSSKIPQQKGLLQVSTGPNEEVQIFSDKEFKGLVKSGAYRCFWNRIFLTGPFGVGKTSLAKMLVGDEAPEERKSTDGSILNATVQSLLRSKEVTAPSDAYKSIDDIENTGAVKHSEETKTQDPVTSISDAGAVKHSRNMSDPGALKSQDNIPHAVKKKSKLKTFLDIPNRIQKAFKGTAVLSLCVNMQVN
ncbi:ankyrin-2-like [Mytilus californianus]|uniref:ankyrin-2-like n=1 Tax=Mytilus californianus TaxID=6549 RepID=UPI002245EF72|nr:ankyrin-2-like [Mytilus californianus]